MKLPDKQLLTPEEVCEILNIQIATFYSWAFKETKEFMILKPLKVGQQWRIKTSNLQSYIEKQVVRRGRPPKKDKVNNIK